MFDIIPENSSTKKYTLETDNITGKNRSTQILQKLKRHLHLQDTSIKQTCRIESVRVPVAVDSSMIVYQSRANITDGGGKIYEYKRGEKVDLYLFE